MKNESSPSACAAEHHSVQARQETLAVGAGEKK